MTAMTAHTAHTPGPGTMRNRVVKQFTAAVGPTDITTYYIRDAQGNVMATYEKASSASTVNWKEAHIYGSSRLGMEQPNLQVNPRPYTAATNPNNTTTASQAQLLEGWKRYELTNHLGNVLSVITDRKLGREVGTADNIIDQYDPEIIAAQDYYPFGMVMPCREYTANFTVTNCATQLNQNSYRYGFNGKEEDDDIKGDGNQQDYGMRIYDPRVGRFLSVDPYCIKYPYFSPYQYVGNSPIKILDNNGDSLRVAGEADEITKFTTMLNATFSDQIKVSIIEKGIVMLTSDASKLNANDKALYNALNAVITDKKTTDVALLNKTQRRYAISGAWQGATVNGKKVNTLDLYDMEKFTGAGASPEGMIIHEIWETYQDQVKGKTKYEDAHNEATKVQGKVDGTTIGGTMGGF